MTEDQRYPKIAPQHDINRAAKSIVDRLLAADWLARRLPEEDYGCDYLVESKEGAHPGGKSFFVQLKGTKSLQIDATGRLGWPMETKHLRYYLERVNLPVFLFVVDVTAGCGWFVFIQGELNTAEMLEKLEKQQSLTLELRLDHRINDTMRLRAAFEASQVFMRERYPGSLRAAFEGEAKSFDQTDPHFSTVKAEVNSKGKVHYTIAPKKNFTFSIKVPANKSKEVFPKLDELFKFGRPLDLTSNEAIFDGLSLFEKAKAEGLVSGISFRPAPRIQCELLLSSSGTVPLNLTIPAILTGGTAGGLLVGKIEGSPLGLELKITHDEMMKTGMGIINLTWDLGAWLGKDIHSLPWIEPLLQFWHALFAQQEIDATITVEGNRLVRGSFGKRNPPEHYREHLSLCEMLYKARELAVARGFKIQFPDSQALSNFDWDDITIAHDVEFKGRHERPAANYRNILRPAPDNDKIQQLIDGGANSPGWARVIVQPWTIAAFGQTLNMGDMQFDVGPVTCHRATGTPNGEFAVELRGDSTSVMSLTRLSSDQHSTSPIG